MPAWARNTGLLLLAAAMLATGCTPTVEPTQRPRKSGLPPPESDIDSMTIVPQDGGFAVDSNGDGRGDVLRIGLYLFSAKTQRASFGDGTLVIRLLQLEQGDPGQPPRLVETYKWELTRAAIENLPEPALIRVTPGWQYRLGLTWPGRQLEGEAILRIEFRSASGRVLTGEEKLVSLTPKGSLLRAGPVRERTTTTQTTTQPGW